MQKKVIALAVAGLVSGAAFAQNNVTIYGIADAGYVHATGNSHKYNGVDSGLLSGSRLGFKGEEALGNGLKAVFLLEYGLGLDTNTGVGTALARQQYVGLSSATMGSVTLGRQYAWGYFASVNNDAFAGSVPSPHAVLTAAGGNTVAPNSNARWNNAVAYNSPTWSGFSVKGIYGFGQTNEDKVGSTERDDRFGLGANYANGPLNVDLVYQTQQNTAGVDKNEWYLGAAYDFKVVKLYGSYQTLNDKSVADADNKIWQLGVGVPVTSNGTVIASYANLNPKNASNNDSTSYALGYLHSMSKRTTLYTTYTHTKNELTAPVAAGPVGVVAAKDKTNNVFTVGVRHSF